MRPVYTGGFFNLLQPYALLAGVVSLAMLVLHGASYAAFKAGAPMAERAASVGASRRWSMSARSRPQARGWPPGCPATGSVRARTPSAPPARC